MCCDICLLTVGSSTVDDKFIPTIVDGTFKDNIYTCTCGERWRMSNPQGHTWKMTNQKSADALPPDVLQIFNSENYPQHWEM
jgi:hypothetical protein